ncbi:MAG TPA: CarD family transcriptional regulator [Rhodospirillaceae bacterium]|jgi:CarD family transcriptional regulator|nr:CarD family transcriptional regulator [Alphaproteobacteria bacterium]HBH26606.1 CarD family transcriptional regulator [Rhodospirillaceae bacterium]
MSTVSTKNAAKNDNAGTDALAALKRGDKVVYAVHGVGEFEGIETATIGGEVVHLYVVFFPGERMRLKIPVFKARAGGLRRLATGERLEAALTTIKGRARIRRTMWSRRAAEYEAKINSGDPVLVAEVLRDLKRVREDAEQSYSERQIYQHALSRLAREVAAVDGVSEEAAAARLESIMGVAKPKEAPEADPADAARTTAIMIARARKAA